MEFNKGFKKEVLDQSLFAKIQQFYNENQDKAETEIVEGFIHNSEDDEPVSTLVELDAQLKNEIHSHLKPLLEKAELTLPMLMVFSEELMENLTSMIYLNLNQKQKQLLEEVL